MEKVSFYLDEQDESVSFFVLEKTKINGSSYLLVAESEDEDSLCMILKGIEADVPDEEEEVYQVVEDDTELLAVSKVFEELLEDIDIEL